MTVISPRKSPLFNFSCEYVNHYLKSLASFFSYCAASCYFCFGFFVNVSQWKVALYIRWCLMLFSSSPSCYCSAVSAFFILYLSVFISFLLFALFYHPGFVLFIEPLMFEHFCSISLLIIFSILSHFPLHLSSCLSCTHSHQQPFRDSHMWFIVVVIPLRPHIPLSCRDIISS